MSDWTPPKICNGCDNPESLCDCRDAIVPPRIWIAPSDVRWLAKNNPDEMDVAIPFYSKSHHLTEVALLLNKASHPGTWLDGSDEVLRVIEKARDLLLEVMDG